MFKKDENTIKASEPVHTISKAAQLVGLSVQMLRLYENEGLIIPFRKDSLHRKYSEDDIERLRCIREMINKDKISIAGIKRILALIPCWALKKCPDDVKRKCVAFKDYTKPCWMHKLNNLICESAKCRNCLVYESFSNCSKIKQILNQVDSLVLEG